VGGRACRQLVQDESVEGVILADRRLDRVEQLARQMGERVRPVALDRLGDVAADAVVVTVPAGHLQLVELWLSRGSHIVSTVTSVPVVRALLDLEGMARELGRSVVVGAAMAPGLSCVLARHGSVGMDRVDEIAVAKTGVGGPACRSERWESLGSRVRDRRGRPGVPSAAGTIAELVWFPSPVGSVECRGGAHSDEPLLSRAFPGVRVAARAGGRAGMAAGLREPFRSWWPQVEPIGALRVELRGHVGQAVEVRVLGAVDRPSVAAGAVAAQAARWADAGRLERVGAGGLADLVGDTIGFLGELAERGVKAAALGKPSSAIH
jgi:hypothetical protein